MSGHKTLPGSGITIKTATWRDLKDLHQLEKICFKLDAWPLLDIMGVLAMPQIIRYQSTLALLHRAARQPDLFTRVAEKRWRLRLFELQLAANSCLPNASDAPKRAALVVTVDLPRDVFTTRLSNGGASSAFSAWHFTQYLSSTGCTRRG